MPYTFTTPTVEEGPIGTHRLFQFYKLARGVTVARYGEDILEFRYPSEDDLALADDVWVGGHSYTISDASADILSAAGYDDYLVEV
jgi:hypothetical protein